MDGEQITMKMGFCTECHAYGSSEAIYRGARGKERSALGMMRALHHKTCQTAKKYRKLISKRRRPLRKQRN